MGGPETNDDIDDALRGGWGGNHQNDDVIYEWVLCFVTIWICYLGGGRVL